MQYHKIRVLIIVLMLFISIIGGIMIWQIYGEIKNTLFKTSTVNNQSIIQTKFLQTITITAIAIFLLTFLINIIFYRRINSFLGMSIFDNSSKQNKEILESYEILVNNILNGVIILDSSGNICFTNEQADKIFGRSHIEMNGFNLGIPVTNINTKETKLDIVTPLAEHKIVIIRGIPTKWQSKPAWQITIQDITEQVNMENQLHEKAKLMISQSRQVAMGDMIAMIAHQWRQPIAVIAMAINRLKVDIELGEEITKEELQEIIEHISFQIEHLSKTIDDFRDFLKPTKEKVLISVCTVMDQAIKMMGKSLENNSIKINITTECKSEILISSNELLQVFLNIINNAKDALIDSKVDNACVYISINENREVIRIEISDNAKGIPKEIFEQLGEPYISTKAMNGTGLSIYMSKIIIEKHLFGKLTWKNLDKGACFTIEIPLK